jgi:hypothetical protein
MRKANLIVGLAFLVAPVHAADGKGNFALDGGGGALCKAFVESVKSSSPESMLFAGWIDGYFTAFNQFNKDLYDVTPWQSNELLRAMLAEYCRKNPDHLFAWAVVSLAEALRAERLTAISELVKAESGTQGVMIYRAVLQRAQQALSKRGDYKGAADGTFDAATLEAFKRFQTDKKLSVTGLPDQRTLYVLFYRSDEGAKPTAP